MAQAVAVSLGDNTSTINWNGESWNGSYYPITASQWRFLSGTAASEGYTTHSLYIQGKEVKEMRGLFHIVLVDYKTEEAWDWLIIADNAEKAKIKALLHWGEDYPSSEVDDLDIICNKLGDVRKKTEITPVRVVSED